jgi:hypothetical protein
MHPRSRTYDSCWPKGSFEIFVILILPELPSQAHESILRFLSENLFQRSRNQRIHTGLGIFPLHAVILHMRTVLLETASNSTSANNRYNKFLHQVY